MSYVRRGDDSDIYIIGSSSFLECCGCRLYKNSACFKTYSGIIKHLNEHIKFGDKVPPRAKEKLLIDQKEEGNIYMSGVKRIIKNRKKTKDELLQVKLSDAISPIREAYAEKVVDIFKQVYGRKPNRLEKSGLVNWANIDADLAFLTMGFGKED